MYDIELVINVCNKPPFNTRIDSLFERGLLNVGETKVLLRLLVGPQEINVPNIPNVDVVQETHPIDDVTVKTYHHFGYRYTSTARWIAKFDDDTATDIGGLVSRLDQFYDWQIPTYLTNEDIRYDLARYDRINLEDCGYKEWIDLGVKFYHEIEGCVLSATLMDRILGNDQVVNLLRSRSRSVTTSNVPNWNDQTLGIASRIVGVTPAECHFMSHYADIGNFSILKGRYVHIHELAHDKNAFVSSVFNRLLQCDVSTDLPGVYAMIDARGATSSMIFENGGTINGNAGKGKRIHRGAYIDISPDKLYLMLNGSPHNIFHLVDGAWHCGDLTLRKFV